MGLLDLFRSKTPPMLYLHGTLGEEGCHMSTVKLRNSDAATSFQPPNKRNRKSNSGGLGPAALGSQNGGGGMQSMHETFGQMSERRSSHRSGALGSFPGSGNGGINPGIFGQTGTRRGSAMQGSIGFGGGSGVRNSHHTLDRSRTDGSSGTGGHGRWESAGSVGAMGGFGGMGSMGFGRGGMGGSGGMSFGRGGMDGAGGMSFGRGSMDGSRSMGSRRR